MRALLAAATLALALAGGQGQAATTCMARDALLAKLAEGWQERPAAAGLANTGAVYELVMAEDQASWSLVVTHPSGTSCLVVAGRAWVAITPPAGEPM